MIKDDILVWLLFIYFQGLFTVDIKSSKARVNKKNEAHSDSHGSHHDEVIEGTVVPSLDRDVRSIIADLVVVDPVRGLPVHHVTNENEKDGSNIPCKKVRSVFPPAPAQSDTKPVAWVKASEMTGSIGKVSWQH